MPIPDRYSDRHAYHFSSIENLDSIIELGLLSTNQKLQRNVTHVDVAAAGIQCRRGAMEVPGSQGRYVHDYVPFYFAQKTPMQLSVILKKNVDQQFLIYFAVPLRIIDARQGVFFTNASANTDVPPRFFGATESERLNDLNWPIIENAKWKYPDDNERHQKMAELLVPDYVSMGEVAYIVAWNDDFAQHIRDRFAEKGVACPQVVCNSWHYYPDMQDKRFSFITGPYFLKKGFLDAVSSIENGRLPNAKFINLEQALNSVRADFCSITELANINGLAANYGPHKDDVGTHSRRVAELVRASPEYLALDLRGKQILEFAAFLHDIGKGPKTRWANSFMDKPDSNHSCKSLPMLQRILTEDVGGLSSNDIRQLVLLVTYDDLLGEIAAKGRDKKQLLDVISCEEDVNMLVALSRADIGALDQGWLMATHHRIEQLRDEAFRFLRGKA
ncbi:DarT ssDNA thymidine ADP-ribosyltransferase family protein [Pseudomonas citronellolis]|jgi:hypothetical protein|uniref:DarT ssDNA thymidine ADP-ribosyltransferase family protein n=1 Tax=Pseudomonas citronellolis TaxID=53408 RepID=UPI00226FD69F|nr:DarT ssDNA thymidine ADP-ribosyltransferase family protein [Pseudomonas citronellolis]WAB90344.1 DarT ssDNA thymidine ADP-ribosyltransferase family protein [Pseudomonas citronellolis]